MGFESDGVSEDWMNAMIVPLCKGKREMKEYKKYRVLVKLEQSAHKYQGTEHTVIKRTN